ncbi:MAG: hypothetical protein KJO55_08690 [Gammaproteobacteria bacterium]|nr:hypothetical protein [Gammaproteobacteria bacterium]NND59471.1 PilZ domain-containing protein [Gammaproteobacteria bacterium]
MSDDRRRSFRIDNPVVLVYKVVSEKEMNKRAASVRQGGFMPGGVSSTLFGMEAEFKGRIGRIRHKSAEVAQALTLLNDKMNALINLMPMMQDQDSGQNLFEQPMRRTNVSATGIAFPNDEELASGTCLRLRLLLAPDYYYVAGYARVIRTTPRKDPRDGFEYRVAADFVLISDQHKELLVKYTMSRELAMLRARRLAAEASEDAEARQTD